ncbi:MAG: hypothetical protein M1840_008282 [Geoglossum simile]|nr:MAG: hypothetical protein M1840_008282 [Geoglossum simile]
MRLLLRSNTGEFSLTKDLVGNDVIPPYAILSHTWKEGQEVTFKDLMDGTGKSKTGYNKIQFCGQQAKRDDLQYFWVDTCCIDKSNNVELQEAINSMFRWYQNAAKCYVYLSDVSTTKRKASDHFSEFIWEPAFRESRWATKITGKPQAPKAEISKQQRRKHRGSTVTTPNERTIGRAPPPPIPLQNARALFNFIPGPENELELEFNEGEMLEFIDVKAVDENGWLRGSVRGDNRPWCHDKGLAVL